MRSRYSAYVCRDRDYLLNTWHPSTRPADLNFEPGIRWLGLRIVESHNIGSTRAEVEFVARSRVGDVGDVTAGGMWQKVTRASRASSAASRACVWGMWGM